MDKTITLSVKLSKELLDGSIEIKGIIESELNRQVHDFLLSENKRIEKLILEGDPSKEKPVGISMVQAQAETIQNILKAEDRFIKSIFE